MLHLGWIHSVTKQYLLYEVQHTEVLCIGLQHKCKLNVLPVHTHSLQASSTEKQKWNWSQGLHTGLPRLPQGPMHGFIWKVLGNLMRLKIKIVWIWLHLLVYYIPMIKIRDSQTMNSFTCMHTDYIYRSNCLTTYLIIMLLQKCPKLVPFHNGTFGDEGCQGKKRDKCSTSYSESEEPSQS